MIPHSATHPAIRPASHNLRALLAGATLLCLARGAGAATSFRAEIAPILLEHCQTCHGPSEQRGGYRLDTFGFLSKSEDPAEPVLSPGKPLQSSLYKLLVAADSSERMPKKAPPLSPAQTEKIKQWISEGAPFDGESPDTPLVEILPPKTHPPAPEAYAAPVPVTALAFTPDGDDLLVGGLREVLVRDASSGALKRRIGNVSPRTFDIAFHPDGKSFITAGGAPGECGEVRQYDLVSGKFLGQLAAASDVFLDAEFTPDGKSLVLAGADHSLTIVDMQTAKKRHRLHAHSDAVTGLAVSPDGKWFASVSLDRVAKVFETDTAKLKATYRDHQSALYAVGFLPENELISAGKDKAAHVWNRGEPKKKRELSGQGDLLRAVVSGGTIFAGGSAGKVIRATSDKLTVARTFEGLSDWVYSIAHHAGADRIAAGSYDGMVALWDASSGQLRAKFNGVPEQSAK